jgi:hypothetical protein
MPGAISRKVNDVYEWCVQHIFILIGVCVVCLIIMQLTKKANFANVPPRNNPPRPPITLEQKRSPNGGGYNAPPVYNPPVYNPPANNQPRTAARRR